jgi:hypothetical protein
MPAWAVLFTDLIAGPDRNVEEIQPMDYKSSKIFQVGYKKWKNGY